MAVLAGTVLGHARHDFRRHVQHLFAEHIGNIPVRAAGWRFLFGGESLKPRFKGKARRIRRLKGFVSVADRRKLPSSKISSILGYELERRMMFVALHPNLVLVLAGLREIVGRLQAQPVAGVRPAGFLQPDGHFGRYAGTAVQDAREGVAGHTQHFGALGHVQAQRIKAAILDRVTRMRGVFHGHEFTPF
ncbi:hypothetical protein SBA4_790011 [Candidatus Sulfopaludibacter sp. SbA4]|nr:hypothetical protein SBA4_790011 [Candidatus Sulfopaludibacter sp. SbA4]